MSACLYRKLARILETGSLSLLVTGYLALSACAGMAGTGNTAGAPPSDLPGSSPSQAMATPSPLITAEPVSARIDQSRRGQIIEKLLGELDWCVSLKPGPLPGGLDQAVFDHFIVLAGQTHLPGLGKNTEVLTPALDFELEASLQTRKSAIHAYARVGLSCRVYDSRRQVLGEFVNPGAWTMSDLDVYDAAYRSLLQTGGELLNLAGVAVRDSLTHRWADGIAFHLDVPEGTDADSLKALLERVYRDPRVVEAVPDQTGTHGRISFFGSLEELKALVQDASAWLSGSSDGTVFSGLKVEND